MKHFNATQNVKERTSEVLTELKEILSRSYSPFGSSSIMINKDRVSKDGYEILNSLQPEGEFEQFVTNSIRSLTNQTLFTAGDGKTTAVLLAEALFRNLNEVYEEKYEDTKTPQEFIMDVNEVKDLILETLDVIKYEPKSKEDYVNVAHTSLNNDDQLVEYIKEALTYFEEGEDPDILTSKNTEDHRTYVDAVEGFKIAKSLDYGLKANDGVFEDIKVLSIGERLENNQHIQKLWEIMDYCSDEGQHLIVLYPDGNNHFKRMIRNKMQKMHMEKKPMNTLFIKVSSGGTLDDEKFYDDFMAYLGTITLNVSEEDFTDIFFENFDNLSTVDIHTKETSTIFIARERAEDILYTEKLDEIERGLESLEGKEKRKLEERYNRLTKETVSIRVGANTSEDRDRIFNMFQDATLAIKHSQDGIVSGMNTAIPKTISTINVENTSMDDTIFDAIKESYMDLLNLIVDKSRRDVSEDVIKEVTNLKDEEKHILKTYDIKKEELSYKIVNSYRAEKVILDAALEIVKILITSNQIMFSSSNARNYYESQGRVTKSTPVEEE